MATISDPDAQLTDDFFDWNKMFYTSWPVFLSDLMKPPLMTIILIIIISTVVGIGIAIAFRKLKTKVKIVTATMMGSSRPRFRKRDKVMFYGRKMLRKVRLLSSQAVGGRTRIKKRQMVLRFAKRLLRLKREQPLTLQVMEPSQAFLEEAISDHSEQRLPPEVMYMLKSIRVFGFFEKPLFLELCKHIESSQVAAGSLLFSIGEPDDSIYVVQNGRLVVYVTEMDGTELNLKEVGPGESIVSLLSVMDVLTGHIAPYKTVSARALEDCNVLRLRVEAFHHLLQKYPESLVRVAQIIMVRLQRVTFTALHNYLGLTLQLIRSSSTTSKRTSTIISPKGSPSKPTSRRTSQVTAVRPFVTESHSNGKLATVVDKQGTDGSDMDDGKECHSVSEVAEVEAASLPSACSMSLDVQPVLPSQKPVTYSQPVMETATKIRKRRTSFYFPPDQGTSQIEEEDLNKLAVKGFVQNLGLNDDSLVKDFVTVKELTAGTCIIQEETVEDVALLYVIIGSLNVSQKTVDKKEESTLFVAHAGEIVGALAVLSGEPSVFTVKTRHASCVGMLSKKHTYEILRKQPLAVLLLAQSVIKRLSSFVRQIDFALDWINVESGRAIYRQGDISDCTYILLSGRLRSVLTRDNGKKELVGEYGRGDLVGIVEVLTLTKRSTTVMAVRDSELAKLPEGLLNAIKIKFPEVVTRLIHLLGHRILGTLQKGLPLTSEKALTIDSRPTGSNFATVAILSVTEDVPLSAFTMELYHAITSVGPTLRLTSEFIKKTLGPTALTSANEYRLCSWLGQQEDQHKIVLYQCDPHFSTWTQRCIRQADCIIIVALADQEPTVGEIERQLEHLAVRTQKELILLHRDDGIKPRNTVLWLNIRAWCSSHHHIRCHKRMFTKKSPTKMAEMYNRLYENPPSIHSDFSRLARFLTGTSIGLVLGGGGARGAAHVGMIRAITEAGIPVDMVGGVSIGAFMGALWCQEKDITTFTQKAREWSLKMTSYWRQILDLTYPVTAMFTGAAFNRAIHEVFGERQIEDLWLPYFTVTTDITDSTMRVHTHADIMREMGAETIIAIDVGSQDDTDLTNYGDTLSGWWLLWKRWNPWAVSIKVPSLPEIQSRLAYVSCVRQLDQVKRSDYCTYVRPPIDKYKTLQFGSFDEIMEVGFNHGKALFTAMKRGHKSLHSFLHKEKTKYHHQHLETLRNASFTDLAEMVCKIQPPRRYQLSDVSDEEEEELYERDAGYTSEPDPSLLGDTDKLPFEELLPFHFDDMSNDVVLSNKHAQPAEASRTFLQMEEEDYSPQGRNKAGSLSDVEYTTEGEDL